MSEITKEKLLSLLDELEGLLPNQGPLQVFIHHNTLHAFEKMEFYKGIEVASEIYGAHAYLREFEYQNFLETGRIAKKVVLKHLKKSFLLEKYQYLKFKEFSAIFFCRDSAQHENELMWLEQLLSLKSNNELVRSLTMQQSLKIVEKYLNASYPSKNLHIDCYKAKIFSINPEDHFLKLCATYLDHGMAQEQLADRKQSFFEYCLNNLRQTSVKFSRELQKIFNDYEGGESLPQIFLDLTVLVNFKEQFLNFVEVRKFIHMLGFKYPGWAGAFAQKHQLLDFLSALLLFCAVYKIKITEKKIKALNYVAVASRLYAMQFSNMQVVQKALELEFKLAELLHALCYFENNKRLEIFHRAYEDTLHSEFLALVKISSQKQVASNSHKFNFVFCLDEREESFRRHLESENSQIATFGYAGFFGLDAKLIDEKGSARNICPPFITPVKTILESSACKHSFSEKILEVLRSRLYNLQIGVFGTVILSIFAPILAAFSLLSAFARNKEHASSVTTTKFNYLQTDQNPAGFSIEEIASRLANLLKTTGIIKSVGKLIIFVGHGAKGVNNPYKSAYDCGACGGRPGDVNSKIFAEMANLPAVREQLMQAGIELSAETYFVGAYHNTTTDEVVLFDTDKIPKNYQQDLQRLRQDLQRAAIKNAKERTRHFISIKNKKAENILPVLKRRALYIAEPRPEYGHATNALCIIGRRELSKDLFLDRRAFLVSYDQSIDKDSQILRNILNAIVPVCMGINLEYYFSSIDNYCYGAGSKLPQNVVGGFATMTGSLGDLRTGLPKQMVEIHEPVRLAVLVEASRESIGRVLASEPKLDLPIKNSWLRLFYLSNDGGNIQAYCEDDNICAQLATELYQQDNLAADNSNFLSKSGLSKLLELK